MCPERGAGLEEALWVHVDDDADIAEVFWGSRAEIAREVEEPGGEGAKGGAIRGFKDDLPAAAIIDAGNGGHGGAEHGDLAAEFVVVAKELASDGGVLASGVDGVHFADAFEFGGDEMGKWGIAVGFAG